MSEMTDEEFAAHCANQRCPEQGPEFITWCMSRDDVLLGIAEGRRRNAEEGRVASEARYRVEAQEIAETNDFWQKQIAEREEQAAREAFELMAPACMIMIDPKTGMILSRDEIAESFLELWKQRRGE